MYSTTIGKLTLPHFVYNAAGVWDTTTSQCQELALTDYCGAIITKSCTMYERKGNQYPKYYSADPRYFINSNGLENYGLRYYIEKIPGIIRKPRFISIGGLSDEERFQMLNEIKLYKNLTNTGIELNLSCPNLGCAGPAYDASTLDRTLEQLFQRVGPIRHTFGLKLPPYYLTSEFEAISNVLYKYQQHIDFITCINGIPNGLDYNIDNNMPVIVPNGGYGGISGPAILPVGLANVNRFSTLFRNNNIDIKIVGCGGVTSGEDLYKYLLAGASAVQVGTHLWKNGPYIFEELSDEFNLIMQRKGYTFLSEIPY